MKKQAKQMKQVKKPARKAKADKNIITKQMTFAEIMAKKPEAGMILMQKGMHCIGCGMAMMETLEQGAIMHGLDADEIVKELNQIGKRK